MDARKPTAEKTPKTYAFLDSLIIYLFQGRIGREPINNLCDRMNIAFHE